ncbi:hypothetical protein MBLNU230_g2375t1 [Neophaeotheca triangularis]
METSEPQNPQRLSALYQYHNAPEVAPAHGLEYDDNVYSSSDKYPVVHQHHAVASNTPSYENRYTGKHAYENSNKPPRIIFGMKVRTFLIVAFVMVLVITGAAVGGAVGGKSVHDGTREEVAEGSASTSPTPTPTTATRTFSPQTPTYTPLTNCPRANNTLYAPTLGNSPDFSLHCDLASPLRELDDTRTLTRAFVYSFTDCIDLCAGFNVGRNGDAECGIAVYRPEEERPSNCWVGRKGGEGEGVVEIGRLGTEEGTEVAVLVKG